MTRGIGIHGAGMHGTGIHGIGTRGTTGLTGAITITTGIRIITTGIRIITGMARHTEAGMYIMARAIPPVPTGLAPEEYPEAALPEYREARQAYHAAAFRAERRGVLAARRYQEAPQVFPEARQVSRGVPQVFPGTRQG